tara:strand:+ start:15601 stop:15852 length:252 start_codon:yes stop_codon:yes gene_type:complete
MNMENIVHFDLKTFPDIADMLEGVSPGDIVKVSASFQVKELSEKRFTGAFEDKEGITITAEGEDSDEDDQTEEEEPEGEEASG